MTEYLFVYGSLLSKIYSPMSAILACYCEYAGKAQLQGKLYDVLGYPGAVESNAESDKVFGELYKILNQKVLFQHLDHYEECTDAFPTPQEYIRKQLPVNRYACPPILAWCYVYNREVSGLTRIISGNYLDYVGVKT